jgi:hypothetical protein
MDPSGNFVVAWSSFSQDGSGVGVFGQRYLASGTPVGPEFRVNTFTAYSQDRSSLASGSGGNFVVTWSSSLQDGSGYGIFGQRYGAAGAPMGPEFRVNSYVTNQQDSSSVSADAVGNFVVAWSSYTQDGSGLGVFAQRFASSGVPLGPEFRVNTYTTNVQVSPSVAMDPSGNFVVVWHSRRYGNLGFRPFGQRYASSGAPLGSEFGISSSTTEYGWNPAVDTDALGNFVVVWSGYPFSNSLFARRYASSGAPLGPDFRVNTFTGGIPASPSVALDSSGDFVVIWTIDDGAGVGVFGQRYAASGTPLGGEFRVNTYTTSNQGLPSVGADPGGNFVVVWASADQDGSMFGVFGQRFAPIVPVELMDVRVE